MTEDKPINRSDYKYFHLITTRWMDNDVYGHINNVTYYSYFDTAVNQHMIDKAGFVIEGAPIVGYVVHTNCNFIASIAHPNEIEVGVHVKKMGNSSVTYGVGIFKKGEDTACAYGDFVHVFVNRAENKSVAIPSTIRTALEKILIEK